MIQARACCLRTPESLPENEFRRWNSRHPALRTCCKHRLKEPRPTYSYSSRQRNHLQIYARSCSESDCIPVEIAQLLHGELHRQAEAVFASHLDRNQNAGAYRISRIPVASRSACRSENFLPTPSCRIVRAVTRSRFPHGESYSSGLPIPSRNFP